MVTKSISPSQSINTALSGMTRGDILVLNMGTYSAENITPPAGVTIVGNGDVWLGNSFFSIQRDGIILDNLKARSNMFIDIRGSGAFNCQVLKCTNIFSGTLVKHSIIVADGAHDILIEDCKIEGGTWNSMGIQGPAYGTNSANPSAWTNTAEPYNIIIRRCIIINNHNHSGIDLFGNCRGISLLGNVLYGNWKTCIYGHQGTVSNSTIGCNRIYDSSGGIYFDANLFNSVIEKNVIYNIKQTLSTGGTVPGKAIAIDAEGLYGSVRSGNNQILNNFATDGIRISGTAALSGNNFSSGWEDVPYSPPPQTPIGCNTVSLPPPEGNIMTQITNVTVATGKVYPVDTISTSKPMYTDRIYTIGSIPSEFVGLQYIRTANDDRTVIPPNPAFLQFDIDIGSIIYVAWDNRGSRPAWLTSSFVDTGKDMARSDGVLYSIYSKQLPAGHVALGTADIAPSALVGMYLVFAEGVAAPPPPPPPPTPTKINVTATNAGNGQVMAYNDPTRVGNSYSLLLDPGAPYEFTAVPNQGYQFDLWVDNTGKTYFTISISGIATADITYTAYFIPGCIPNWVCEMPLNGYEKDGCGNRRLNPACSPAPVLGGIDMPSPIQIVVGQETDVTATAYDTNSNVMAGVPIVFTSDPTGIISITPVQGATFTDGKLTTKIKGLAVGLTTLKATSYPIGRNSVVDVNAAPLPPPEKKWKCSGAPDYTCIQADDGIYATQAECQAACKKPEDDSATQVIIIGVILKTLGAL